MAERTRKDRLREGTNLIAFTLFAIIGMWQSVTTSLTYSAAVQWVATDNIAYYAWGFIPGLFLPLPFLYGWYIWRVFPGILFPGIRAFAPVTRIRDRPRVAFAIGLAVGSVVWSVGLTVALVITGTQVPWPLAYGNGFVAGLVVWAAIVYAVFLAYPCARPATASRP